MEKIISGVLGTASLQPKLAAIGVSLATSLQSMILCKICLHSAGTTCLYILRMHNANLQRCISTVAGAVHSGLVDSNCICCRQTSGVAQPPDVPIIEGHGNIAWHRGVLLWECLHSRMASRPTGGLTETKCPSRRDSQTSPGLSWPFCNASCSTPAQEKACKQTLHLILAYLQIVVWSNECSFAGVVRGVVCNVVYVKLSAILNLCTGQNVKLSQALT